MYKLILASESPRRRELLASAGFSFQVSPVKVSEFPDKSLNVQQQILDIAGRKARAAYTELRQKLDSPFVVLAADTEVILDGSPLGKPHDDQNAAEVLRRLSGRQHEVLTALHLIESSTGKAISHLETTTIVFRDLQDSEIQGYIATGEHRDKAGSYGIQGKASAFVEKIEGDFENVVGLPVKALRSLIAEQGWIFEAAK